MTPLLRPELDLDFPDGRGVHFSPPVLPLDIFCDWLQSQHEERARKGDLYGCLQDPKRRPVDAPFHLD